MSLIRVDFYLLTTHEEHDRLLFICRLLEKAYLKGHRIFVLCNNQYEAEQIDELLWTFKDNSFIPHNLQGEGPEPPPPVQIGFQDAPRGFSDILVNLSIEVPSFYARFQRIIEVVDKNEDAKTTSRAHYRIYRQKQCELFTHSL